MLLLRKLLNDKAWYVPVAGVKSPARHRLTVRAGSCLQWLAAQLNELHAAGKFVGDDAPTERFEYKVCICVVAESVDPPHPACARSTSVHWPTSAATWRCQISRGLTTGVCEGRS